MRQRRELRQGIAAGRIYTVPELAGVLQIGSQTIYNKLSKGESLPRCFRIGNKVRFRGKEIIEFIERQLP